MPDQDLAAELAKAREEIGTLRQRLDMLEQKLQSLPQTGLLNRNFVARAFTVQGHYLFASIITALFLVLALERDFNFGQTFSRIIGLIP
jgi:hypothetical protein